MSIPSVSVRNVSSSGSSISLAELCNGKIGVIDFWHTKCTRCPAAIDSMNQKAAANPQFTFIACALSLGPRNFEDVQDLTIDWSDLCHVFADESAKEVLKTAFGFSSVPFYVVFDKDGKILASGEPKSVDYMALMNDALNKETSGSAGGAGGIVLDEDF